MKLGTLLIELNERKSITHITNISKWKKEIIANTEVELLWFQRLRASTDHVSNYTKIVSVAHMNQGNNF